MLNKFRLTKCKAVSTPMEAGANLRRTRDPRRLEAMRMRGVTICEAIGCVLWRYDKRGRCALRSENPLAFIQNP